MMFYSGFVLLMNSLFVFPSVHLVEQLVQYCFRVLMLRTPWTGCQDTDEGEFRNCSRKCTQAQEKHAIWVIKKITGWELNPTKS